MQLFTMQKVLPPSHPSLPGVSNPFKPWTLDDAIAYLQFMKELNPEMGSIPIMIEHRYRMCTPVVRVMYCENITENDKYVVISPDDDILEN